MKATHTVHWATGPVNCCEPHARKLVGLGNFLRTHVVCTPCVEDEECINCVNEAKLDEPKKEEVLDAPKPTRTPERIELPGGYLISEIAIMGERLIYAASDLETPIGSIEDEHVNTFASAMKALQGPAPVLFDISKLSAEELEKLWKDVKEPGTISVVQSPAGEWREGVEYTVLDEPVASQSKPQSDEGLREAYNQADALIDLWISVEFKDGHKKSAAELIRLRTQYRSALSQALVPTSGGGE